MPLPQKQKPAADTAAIARLAGALADLAGPAWRDLRYGVAVSGGPDSMALLWLMAEALPDHIWVATVDHGLRSGSAAESEMVAEYCRSRNIPHAILRPDAPIKGSLQAAARAERYRLIEEWRADNQLVLVATAHHADDQLETVIMRLNRGSGVGGLSAIRRRNDTIIRPLLDWRRAELATIAKSAHLPCVDDPSNVDPQFDRARLRHALADQDFIDPISVARSANWLAMADSALDWAAQQAIAGWADADDISVIRDEAYPAEIFRRIVDTRIRGFDSELTMRGPALDDVIAAMHKGQRAMIGTLLIDSVKMQRRCWHISVAPPRKARQGD